MRVGGRKASWILLPRVSLWKCSGFLVGSPRLHPSDNRDYQPTTPTRARIGSVKPDFAPTCEQCATRFGSQVWECRDSCPVSTTFPAKISTSVLRSCLNILQHRCLAVRREGLEDGMPFIEILLPKIHPNALRQGYDFTHQGFRQCLRVRRCLKDSVWCTRHC